MPVEIDFLSYYQSIATEMAATKDRIRNLIGGRHWQSDGEHKEAVLRRALRNYVPDSIHIGKGFVCFQSESTRQIDVLLTSKAKPTLFKDGELVLVTPDAARAIIEVKTKIESVSSLREVLKVLSKNVERVRVTAEGDCLAGLFVFEDNPRVSDESVLTALQTTADDDQDRAVNWVSFGPNRFFRFWRDAADVESICEGAAWHSYGLNGGLAHAYFISNVVWDVTQMLSDVDPQMQYAYFPIEGTKERFRQWCISLKRGNGPLRFQS